MDSTQSCGRISGTVLTGANSANLDITAAGAYLEYRSVLKILVSSDQSVTLTVKLGRAEDSISSLPHTLTESVTGGTTLMVVIPVVPGIMAARIYLANASGSTATYTVDAGVEEC